MFKVSNKDTCHLLLTLKHISHLFLKFHWIWTSKCYLGCLNNKQAQCYNYDDTGKHSLIKNFAYRSNKQHLNNYVKLVQINNSADIKSKQNVHEAFISKQKVHKRFVWRSPGQINILFMFKLGSASTRKAL